MNLASNFIIPLFVAIPLGCAFMIALIGKRGIKFFDDTLGSLATLCLSVLSVFAVYSVNMSGSLVCWVGGWSPVAGGPPIGISMVIDGLTAFMLVTVNVVAFCISLFSIDYMEKFTSKWKFYTLFLLMLAGMNGVIVTGDMFNLFVFLEIASVASYALVAFGTEKHELEAAFKYAVMSTVGSLFILLGIALLYGYTSTLNMADIAVVLLEKGPKNIMFLISVFFIMGFGLKSAIVPFHAWLPDAHPSAPAPISATLSGVLIKSLGIYALCRIFYSVIGMTPTVSMVLMFLGALSMVIGVFLAIGQWDFKRLLAYHSISQVGYVILAIGLGTPLGILGGLFHLFNHSVFKSLLFLNSGAVEYAADTRDLKEMGGLYEKMPFTGTTAFTASMSIAGIPPFNGFWSKLIIIIACVQAERYGFAFWAVLASMLTLASFMKVMKYGFFGKLGKKLGKVKEVPIFMKLSMGLLACICVAGGVLLIPAISEIFLDKASLILTRGTEAAVVLLEGMK